MNVVDGFFKSIPNLPMMPKVVAQVIDLLGQDDVNLDELVTEISHDVAISARVLRLANSSYYGSNRNIKNLDDAVSLIGVTSLKTLVIASGVTGAFANTGMDLTRFWRHSFLAANIGRKLARKMHEEPETAYLSGLMHGIGQLLINANLTEAAKKIDTDCCSNTVLERQAIEAAELRVDHCRIGAELARRWNFPLDIQKAIRYYTEPFNSQACVYSLVVYVAAHVAHGLQNKEDFAKIVDTLPAEMQEATHMDRDGLLAFVEECEPYLHEADGLF